MNADTLLSKTGRTRAKRVSPADDIMYLMYLLPRRVACAKKGEI